MTKVNLTVAETKSLLQLVSGMEMEDLATADYANLKKFVYEVVKESSTNAKLEDGLVFAHVIECEDKMQLEFLSISDLRLFARNIPVNQIKLFKHLENIDMIQATVIHKVFGDDEVDID